MLFNAVKSDAYDVGCIASSELVGVTPYQVCEAVKKLSNNKASGLDQITAEHLKFVSLRIFPLVSICFTGFLTNRILPDSMLSILLVPVFKDKAGKLCNIDSYRPIALASIVSKVLENMLLESLISVISSSDNQFGFKHKHGIDLCIYALKEIVSIKIRTHQPSCVLSMPLRPLIVLITKNCLEKWLKKRCQHV